MWPCGLKKTDPERGPMGCGGDDRSVSPVRAVAKTGLMGAGGKEMGLTVRRGIRVVIRVSMGMLSLGLVGV